MEPIAAALAEQNIIQIKVDGATSEIAGGDEAVSAEATQALVTITGPALSFLDNTIVGLLEGIVGGEEGLVATIEDITGQDLSGLDLTDDLGWYR